MIKSIKWFIFITLFLFLVGTKIWQSALWGTADIFINFYENTLVYWNAEIYVLFALFIFIIWTALIKKH
jgi:hypothetical protein